MSPTLWDFMLHLGVPIISAALAGGGAYYGVKFAITDHGKRLDMMLARQMWVIRKMIALATTHNIKHPDAPINIDDFPADDKDPAYRV